MKQRLILLVLTILLMNTYISPMKAQNKSPLIYPKTTKVDQKDTYFGTEVSDPYRWLENDTAANVAQWVKEENKVTQAYLKAIPFRDKIKKRLEEIYNYPRYSSPMKVGPYYFFFKNDGLQNQSVLYYQKGLQEQPSVFLDPNKLSTDGTVSFNIIGFSNDYRYMAYTLAQSGSDWQEIRVMEVATGKQLDDQLKFVKFSGAAWRGNGFYYSRYPEPVKGKELSNANEFHKVYYHQLGTPQSADELVYEDKTHPLRYHNAQTTEDERFLVLNISEGTDGVEIRVKDLKAKNGTFKTIFEGFQQNASVENSVGDQLLVVTNQGAPNYQLVAVNFTNPAKANWKAILPEQKEPLENVRTVGGKLFATYLKDVTTRVYQYDLNGKLEHEIKLPTLGTATGFSGKMSDKELFYTFTSFTYPAEIYRYEVATGTSTSFRKSEVKFTVTDYETKQVFFSSKDGTKVPMFIVHKKGLKLDGTNPTYLYAYGGFNINLTPSFSTVNMVLLENGGVYALANLRGGGEYGEAWHKAGMLDKKQNVFDDFIAAAEYLIAQKYTSSEKLAIAGGSNGGLLVGACMTQRPELYKVAFPAVGVMDMLRFHKFTVGWGWVVEYGSSDNAAQFKTLYAYSPLHNLKQGVRYPSTMVTTADHDDRVVPAHSFKFAATLQEKHRGDNPVLIRIETKAGHGAGTPVSKTIEQYADIWSFFFNETHSPVKY